MGQQLSVARAALAASQANWRKAEKSFSDEQLKVVDLEHRVW